MRKILVTCLTMLALASCASGTKTSKKLRIAVVPKLVGIPYFNAAGEGVLKAGADLGVEAIYTGPATSDAAEQVKVIEDLLVKGVDVIAVAPNDPAAVTPVLARARKQGVIVLDWDTPADPNVVDFSVQQIDNTRFGEVIVDELVKKIGTSGEIGIVTGGLSAANLNSWIKASTDYLVKSYPNIKVVAGPLPSDEQQQLAYQRTLEMIQAYPNIKGILAYSTVAPIGAAQAIQEKNLANKIFLVGTALPTDSSPYLKNKSMVSAVLWDPSKLGYLTVAIGKMLAEKQMPTDGMDIPNVGKISVNDKIIIMGEPTVFTAENAADYNF